MILVVRRHSMRKVREYNILFIFVWECGFGVKRLRMPSESFVGGGLA